MVARSSNSSSGSPRPSRRWRPSRSCARGSLVRGDRKSTRLNSSHSQISYAVFCLKKKKKKKHTDEQEIKFDRRRERCTHKTAAYHFAAHVTMHAILHASLHIIMPTTPCSTALLRQ